jgi:hypothetical protein
MDDVPSADRRSCLEPRILVLALLASSAILVLMIGRLRADAVGLLILNSPPRLIVPTSYFQGL